MRGPMRELTTAIKMAHLVRGVLCPALLDTVPLDTSGSRRLQGSLKYLGELRCS